MARKIDTDANINSIRFSQQTSHPSSPASGYESLYIVSGSAHGGLYVKDSGGRQIGPFITGTTVTVSTESDSGTPTTIRNCILWINANTITGLVDGNTITNQILDRSGAKTQIFTSGGPLYKTNIINSLPVIRFDGSDDHLIVQFPIIPSSYAWLAVFKMASIVPAYTSILSPNIVADAGGYFIKSNGTSAEYRGSNSYDGTGAATFDTTNWNYIVSNHKNTTFDTRRNGAADKSGTTDAPLSVASMYDYAFVGKHVSAGRYASMDLAELIVYSRELTSSEISTLESYIQSKYGL